MREQLADLCGERMAMESPFWCHLLQGHKEGHQWDRKHWSFKPAEEQIAQLQAENSRLRERTHEIQERADKKLAPLEKFHRVTKEQTFPFLKRHGWHPDDGTPNARTWYGYLWEREKKEVARLLSENNALRTGANNLQGEVERLTAEAVGGLADAREFLGRAVTAESALEAMRADRDAWKEAAIEYGYGTAGTALTEVDIAALNPLPPEQDAQEPLGPSREDEAPGATKELRKERSMGEERESV